MPSPPPEPNRHWWTPWRRRTSADAPPADSPALAELVDEVRQVRDELADRIKQAVAAEAERSRKHTWRTTAVFTLIGLLAGSSITFALSRGSSDVIASAEGTFAVGNLDVTAECKRRFGIRATAPREGAPAPTSWQCEVDGEFTPLSISDLEDACFNQYGRRAQIIRTRDLAGWVCDWGFLTKEDGTCTIPPGFVGDTIAVPGGLSSAVTSAYGKAGGQDVVGCPRTPVQAWGGSGGLQEFSRGERDGSDISAIVAESASRAVAVPPEAWRSYSTLRTVALLLFGIPTSEPREIKDLGWVVDLSKRGVLFSVAEDGAYYGLSEFVYNAWKMSGAGGGCLGYPIADANWDGGAEFSQRYERGRMVLSALGGGLTLVPDEGPICGRVSVAEIEESLFGA